MSEDHLGEVLDAYLDNELSVERVLEARAHLASCHSCRQDFEHLQALRDLLQRTLTEAEASPAFLQKVRHSVRRAAPRRWPTRISRIAWAAGPLAVAVGVVLLALPSMRRPAEDLSVEVLGAHLRSLQADHLTDVASSDHHTVNPWFQGKLPFSLPVRDFSEQGFVLEGGRLDYLGSRPVAALVYRARQHVINAFVWPIEAGHDTRPRPETLRGFHLVNWVSEGMDWWLVSDLNEADLQNLVSLLHQTEH